MPDEEPHGPVDRPRPGLALAALITGAVALVLSVSTWAAWLLVLPGFRDAQPYRWIAVVFVLVLGALWFAVLPLSVVAITCGALAANRSATGGLGRLGIAVGVLALLVALAGTVVFVIDATSPPGVVAVWQGEHSGFPENGW